MLVAHVHYDNCICLRVHCLHTCIFCDTFSIFPTRCWNSGGVFSLPYAFIKVYIMLGCIYSSSGALLILSLLSLPVCHIVSVLFRESECSVLLTQLLHVFSFEDMFFFKVISFYIIVDPDIFLYCHVWIYESVTTWKSWNAWPSSAGRITIRPVSNLFWTLSPTPP